jgi:lipopolysaccharide export system protein LptA
MTAGSAAPTKAATAKAALSSSFVLALALVLTSSYGFAQSEKSARPAAGKSAPIVITSKSLTADNKKHTALFSGSVKTVKGDATLYCDEMLVYYTSTEENNRKPAKIDADGKASERQKIKQIDALGNVKLVKENQTVTSQKAVYFADEDKVVFTGNPVARDGRNVVTGSKMTYYLSDDRSIVENSHVILVEEEKENKAVPERKYAPAVNDAPIIKDAPTKTDAPAVLDAPNVKDTSSAKDAPIVSDAPAVKNSGDSKVAGPQRGF